MIASKFLKKYVICGSDVVRGGFQKIDVNCSSPDGDYLVQIRRIKHELDNMHSQFNIQAHDLRGKTKSTQVFA